MKKWHLSGKIRVIFGPPLSGKTTYLRQHFRPGDLAWDMDVVMAAITGLPLHQRGDVRDVEFGMAMRDAFVETALTESRDGDVWILLSRDRGGLLAKLRGAGCEIVTMKTGKAECVERAKARGGEWAGVVENWFQEDGRSVFYRSAVIEERENRGI